MLTVTSLESGAGAGSCDLHGLIDAYLAERFALGQLSKGSVDVTRSVLRRFARHAEGAPLSVDLVRSWLMSCDAGPNTVKSYLTKLRPFVRWLLEHGHLADDITEGIPTPRIPERLPRALPAEAVAKVLAVCPDERARLIVLLMVHAGLRIGEVAAIQVRDVDTRHRAIQVRGKGGRGEVTRAVPLTVELANALDAYLATSGSRFSGPLIASQGNHAGAPVSAPWLGRVVRRWFRVAGVKERAYDGVSAHALRHTCAQDVADNGADLRHVQALLGHRSLRTTQEYLRLSPPGLAEAVEGRTYEDPAVAASVRVHVCVACDRSFATAAEVARHARAKHPGR